MSAAWHVRSRAIDEVAAAADQFDAWDTLRDHPIEDFGLIVTAEPNESDDPIPIHTAALMYSWGRIADAEALIALAVQHDLPDTTEANQAFALRRIAAREETTP